MAGGRSFDARRPAAGCLLTCEAGSKQRETHPQAVGYGDTAVLLKSIFPGSFKAVSSECRLRGTTESRMNKALLSPTQAYRGLIAGYTEAIRSSDFKANIAFLFVAFMMGSVLWNYTSFPSYLPIQLVLLPFLIVYFFLFLVLIPRYPKRGAKSFLVARNLTPEDFEYVAQNVDDPEQLKLTCAVLSDILWWKTQCIRVGFLVAIICVVLSMVLLLYASFA
jgi:hypothetical protein